MLSHYIEPVVSLGRMLTMKPLLQEAAVNRWIGADSRESAKLLNQLANIAESRLRHKPPLPSVLGPLNGVVGKGLPPGNMWSPCDEPSSILNKSVQIGKPQTPVRTKPFRGMDDAVRFRTTNYMISAIY